MIEKSDFLDWLTQPTTKHVFKMLRARIRDREFELGQSAGLDSAHDRFMAGGIAALKSVCLVDWNDVEDVEEEHEE